MQINGAWSRFDDGVVRPVIRAEILADNGRWVAAELLVDTGADRTVFSAGSWPYSISKPWLPKSALVVLEV